MIRQAKKEDVPFITDIYNEAVKNSTATFDTICRSKEEMLQQLLEHTGKYVFLVEEEYEIIRGYASLSMYRPRNAFEESVELSIYIDSKYKGRGIGKRFMEKLIAYAKEQKDIHTIVSLITGDNVASIGLHERYGFIYCGQLKEIGYKFKTYLDLNFYQLFL